MAKNAMVRDKSDTANFALPDSISGAGGAIKLNKQDNQRKA
jgi:hypothetical protein